MSIIWAFIVPIIVTLLQDLVRGFLVRGTERGSLIVVRRLIRLTEPGTAEELTTELIPAIEARFARSRQGAKDDLRRIIVALRQPNDLLANVAWRGGLKESVRENVRSLAVAVGVMAFALGSFVSAKVPDYVSYGWPAALNITQNLLAGAWLLAVAVRWISPPRWTRSRRMASSAAWTAYLGATVALAFGCPRTSGALATFEAVLALIALISALKAAHGGDGAHKWLSGTVPFLLVEAYRVIEANQGFWNGAPSDSIATIMAATAVIAAATRYRPIASATI